jgi:hypothetical protein
MKRGTDSDPLQRHEEPEEEEYLEGEEISLSSADSSRNSSRDELVPHSPALGRSPSVGGGDEDEEEGLEKTRMVSVQEGGMDDSMLEFGHAGNCCSLFVQGTVSYFHNNRHRFRGVLLAAGLVAVLLILAILFISIYDPDAATTERTSTFSAPPSPRSHL